MFSQANQAVARRRQRARVTSHMAAWLPPVASDKQLPTLFFLSCFLSNKENIFPLFFFTKKRKKYACLFEYKKLPTMSWFVQMSILSSTGSGPIRRWGRTCQPHPSALCCVMGPKWGHYGMPKTVRLLTLDHATCYYLLIAHNIPYGMETGMLVGGGGGLSCREDSSLLRPEARCGRAKE